MVKSASLKASPLKGGLFVPLQVADRRSGTTSTPFLSRSSDDFNVFPATGDSFCIFHRLLTIGAPHFFNQSDFQLLTGIPAPPATFRVSHALLNRQRRYPHYNHQAPPLLLVLSPVNSQPSLPPSPPFSALVLQPQRQDVDVNAFLQNPAFVTALGDIIRSFSKQVDNATNNDEENDDGDND
ncbi:unnamed protein product [Lactuca saligna]|uniref:Uncharacterized protein n=1 Tax=Lactuca saligna TaxID=75948 RepID=A0AA35Y467_LACSI|nr:unnamed protein product [Lactuca saligna]